MSYYGQGLDSLGRSIKEGCNQIAKAIEAAAAIKPTPPATYNIVVTGDATPEAVEQAVSTAVRKSSGRKS